MGMGWFRGLGRIAGLGLLAALAVPALALLPAAVLDRGPGGDVRLSWLPIALAALDPFVWQCARNSAAVAALVTAGSVAVGVGLGTVFGRRFWGRPVLSALAMGPMAAGALLIAPGVDGLIGGESSLGYSCEDLARWSGLVWIGLACGAPLVILATTSALARVEPAWADAARAHGASRARVWLDVTWPVIRPDVARAAAAVFALNVAEPVGPIVLGLRRTLAVPMLDAARRLDDPTRAATLALLAIAIAALGRALVLLWGGHRCLGPDHGTNQPRPAAGWRASWVSIAILTAWAAFALGPAVAMLGRAFGGTEGSGARGWATLAGAWVGDPEARVWAANSALTAALALALDLAILAAFATRGPRRAIGGVVRALGAIPPLAFAVGAMATPWLLASLAGQVGDLAARSLRALALELSPGRSPGFALIAVLAAGRLPMLVVAAELARSRSRPVLEDAARLSGLSRRRARRDGDGLWLGLVPAGPATLALILAGTNLAPALLLTSFSERRTIAPAAFELIHGARTIEPRAAGMLAAILGANLLGFLIASRGRAGRIGDWFRV